MTEIPWDIIIALLVPALLSAGTCVLISRSHLLQSQQQSIVMLIAAVSGSLALFFLDAFPIGGSPVLQMPGALCIVIPVLAMLSAILSWRGHFLKPIHYGFLFLGLLLVIHLSSFPWWNRGLSGWLMLILSATAGSVWATLLYLTNRHHPRRALWWLAVHVIACAPLLIALTALGHAQTILIVIFPIAVAGFISWSLKIHSFGISTPLIITATIAVLLANAQIRYVPSPDDPTFITIILRLMPLALCLSAGLALSAGKQQGKKSLLLSTLACAVLVTAAAASLFAYNYESQADTSSNEATDFYYK